jgi:TonB family protein
MFSRVLAALGVVLALTVHLAFGSAGKEQTEGMTLIERASQLSDIRGSSARPFRLKAAFKQFGDGAKTEEGTYTEIWLGRGQWRRDIAVGDFSRTEVDDNGNRWVDGAEEFPGRAGEVAGLLDVTNIYSPVMKVEGVRDADIQGTKAQCVDTKEGGEQNDVLCFDAGTGTLLLKKGWEEHAGRRAGYACRYQQYEKFGDRIFPRFVVCEEDGGQPKLEVRVLELSADVAPDVSVLSPAPPQSTNPACPGVLKPPKAVQKPMPVYPAGQPPGGQVTVGLTVEADGRPSGVRIVHSLGKAFDQSALDAVKRWVFEPARCDGTPMATRVNVVVEFVRP